jgi:hypothetical protein
MKSIDAEIFEIEQRLHVREASLKRGALELKRRSLRALMSPVSIVAAVGLGVVVAGASARRRAGTRAPAISRETKQKSKGFALGGLLMTAATWFIRSEFGGPVGLAQFVLSKVRKDENRGRPRGVKTAL